MANNGKGVGNGKGLDQAEDNFANGYYEHNSNGAADKGLENALDHNPFSMSTTIDFDSGVNTITYSYYYYYYYETGGNYTQDGYTINWYDYEYYPWYYGYSPAISDTNGDGDNEFGGGTGYNTSTYGTLTEDSGETFSLVSVDVENDDGDGYYSYYYDYVYLQAYDASENDWTWSYNYDDGLDTWTTYVYDYDTYTYTTYGAVDSDVSGYYQDISELYLGTYSYYSYYYDSDAIALDNIEVA
jgi:hypothetical protein